MQTPREKKWTSHRRDPGISFHSIGQETRALTRLSRKLKRTTAPAFIFFFRVEFPDFPRRLNSPPEAKPSKWPGQKIDKGLQKLVIWPFTRSYEVSERPRATSLCCRHHFFLFFFRGKSGMKWPGYTSREFVVAKSRESGREKENLAPSDSPLLRLY